MDKIIKEDGEEVIDIPHEVVEDNPTPSSKKKKSKVIDINNVEETKKGNDRVVIDFMEEDYEANTVSVPTEDKIDEPEPVPPRAEIEADIKKKEESELSSEEIADISAVIVTIIDISISSLLRIYAKDDKTSPYELSASKTKILTKQLTILLIKYNVKFKIEIMFIFTLIAIYFVPFNKARENRKREIQIKNSVSYKPKNDGKDNKEKSDGIKKRAGRPPK